MAAKWIVGDPTKDRIAQPFHNSLPYTRVSDCHCAVRPRFGQLKPSVIGTALMALGGHVGRFPGNTRKPRRHGRRGYAACRRPHPGAIAPHGARKFFWKPIYFPSKFYRAWRGRLRRGGGTSSSCPPFCLRRGVRHRVHRALHPARPCPPTGGRRLVGRGRAPTLFGNGGSAGARQPWPDGPPAG